MAALSTMRFRFAVVGIVGIIFVATVILNRREIPKKIVLRDGSEFRILDMDFGHPSVYPRPNFLQRMTQKFPQPLRLTPRPLFDWGSSNGSSSEPRRKVFSILYEHVDPLEKGLVCRIEDENGWSTAERLFLSPDPALDHPVDFMTFHLPRRSRYVKLIISSDKSVPLGEWKFKNPFISNAEKWIASALPQKVTVDGFDFTLTEAQSLPAGKQGMEMNGEKYARWTHLRLKMGSVKDPIENAYVCSITSEDATGNFSQHYTPSGELKNSDLDIWIQDSIWPVEPIRYDIRVRIRTVGSPESVDTGVSFVVQPRIIE